MKTAKVLSLLGIVCALVFVVAGQVSSPRSQITAPIDNSRTVVLRGNVHPWAQARFDRGPAPASLPLERMMLLLKNTPEQTFSLQQLLKEQQNSESPNYHKWLAPQEFGQQFGASEADIQKITAWLKSEGFTIDNVANGRNLIEFSGNAGQLQAAFHASMHKYVIGGKQYWANENDPSIPEALAPVVAGIASLNNFPRTPESRLVGTFARNRAGKLIRKAAAAKSNANPQFTYAGGCQGTSGSNCYTVSPYDFATIYNILPLWTASTPINGSGQTIAIVSDSDINKADFTNFRSLFGLPAGTLNVIYTSGSSSTVPGLTGDESEADVDTQWSGAVAPGATVDLVVSKSTQTSFGGDTSAAYIINNQSTLHASVLGYSYGLCEFFLTTAGNQFYGDPGTGMWTQAAAEGITVVVSTGDNGSTGCDSPSNTPGNNFSACLAPNQSPAPYDDPAVCGLAVNGIGSTPYNVAVGGTDFDDGPTSQAQTYWNGSNSSTTQASVKGYIPERVYNDSCVNVALDALYDQSATQSAEANCNNYAAAGPPASANSFSFSEFVLPFGGGGGVSDCTTPTSATDPTNGCSGGYAKPTWQTGTGVPADGKRDVPDVSLFAGDGAFQNFYSYCQQDTQGSTGACTLSNIEGVGGTSVSAEVFVGMVALLNQQLGTSGPVGLPNQQLYSLAGQSWANCNSSGTLNSACIFYQTTTGNNAMPCGKGTKDCVISTATAPPAVGPGAFNRWRVPVLLLVGCALSLLSFILLRQSSRRWGFAGACIVFFAFVGIAGCSGGGGGGGGTGSYTVGVVEANGAFGYNAAAGYNMATGLGSLNVYNLVKEWDVNPASDFVLSASPAAITTSNGTGTTTITVVQVGSFGATSVDFSSASCSGLPSGASCSFSQPAVPGGQTTTLTITAPNSPGTQPVAVTISGSTGTETRTTTIMLTVP
ncbi:MAG TPA: S53 family peptidase [Candidatus Acidoferrales bacterium]|nr:S53 family peptidase [Candidatus Acidoferrales bacterium]